MTTDARRHALPTAPATLAAAPPAARVAGLDVALEDLAAPLATPPLTAAERLRMLRAGHRRHLRAEAMGARYADRITRAIGELSEDEGDLRDTGSLGDVGQRWVDATPRRLAGAYTRTVEARETLVDRAEASLRDEEDR